MIIYDKHILSELASMTVDSDDSAARGRKDPVACLQHIVHSVLLDQAVLLLVCWESLMASNPRRPRMSPLWAYAKVCL